MDRIEKILKDIGLSTNETKVFLGALKIGAAPISRVAREAGVARTYVYEIAEQLKEKGLFAEFEEKHGIKKVQALDYGGLVAYVERKQRDMQRLEKDLVKAAPMFQALQSSMPQKTKVRFFEGVEGIKSINAEIRKDLSKLVRPYNFYVVFSADRMETVIPGWIEHNQHIYYEQMRKYAIISETPMLKDFLEQVKKHEQKNFFHKVWPQEKKEFPTDTLCWMNKIAILDMTGHPSGIIIENQAIVDTFVMWFRQLWSSLR
ncbi:MAG: hypothetical protein A2751_02085 [Candidatus Doudnabacteria bacterium RIFCSPHIGHO2_01_FULL_46_14]|uniref:Transcription regulator TrmB N-terminal domain-containing protein n=1 Tax=Candidatus Doudnabacteria bacterium RIFCSPHIGHO2_01_FULL_46_14 TaxID=1817824 RepID=A0A1F5NJJ1_9BACT|nr:MAG: hypothetical protein A2751_02085 [Candidatus Doudnabacteria bacterium RIFCSPHIGHO2_01_FULL_46_14]